MSEAIGIKQNFDRYHLEQQPKKESNTAKYTSNVGCGEVLFKIAKYTVTLFNTIALALFSRVTCQLNLSEKNVQHDPAISASQAKADAVYNRVMGSPVPENRLNTRRSRQKAPETVIKKSGDMSDRRARVLTRRSRQKAPETVIKKSGDMSDRRARVLTRRSRQKAPETVIKKSGDMSDRRARVLARRSRQKAPETVIKKSGDMSDRHARVLANKSKRLSKGPANIRRDHSNLDSLKNVWLSSDHFLSYYSILNRKYSANQSFSLPPYAQEHSGGTFTGNVLGSIKPRRGLRKNVLLIPYNNGAHWTLVCVNIEKRSIDFYDSKASVPERGTELRRDLENLASELGKKHSRSGQSYSINWKVENRLQPDGYQCGVWALYFMEELIKDPEANFDHLNKNIEEAQTMIADHRQSIISDIGPEAFRDKCLT